MRPTPSATTARPNGPTGHPCSRRIKAEDRLTSRPTTRTPARRWRSSSPRRRSPVADIAYFGVTFGIQAKKEGVTEAYKPEGVDEIPAGLKDPDGHWFTIHSGTLGFMVNVDALRGKPVPQSWADLLKPEYKGLVGYLDPSSAFVGYVGAVAVNQRARRHARRLRPRHRVLQGAEEERADRAEADLVRARALGRDRDPARLRLQRLPRQVQGEGATSSSSSRPRARSSSRT